MPEPRKTSPKLTSTDATAFMDRWPLVRDQELQELREMTLEQKVHAVAGLMDSAHQLGWSEKMEAEEQEVRDSWTSLRQKLGYS